MHPVQVEQRHTMAPLRKSAPMAGHSNFPQMTPKKGSPCSTVGLSCNLSASEVSRITYFDGIKVNSEPLIV